MCAASRGPILVWKIQSFVCPLTRILEKRRRLPLFYNSDQSQGRGFCLSPSWCFWFYHDIALWIFIGKRHRIQNAPAPSTYWFLLKVEQWRDFTTYALVRLLVRQGWLWGLRPWSSSIAYVAARSCSPVARWNRCSDSQGTHHSWFSAAWTIFIRDCTSPGNAYHRYEWVGILGWRSHQKRNWDYMWCSSMFYHYVLWKLYTK